MFVVCLFFAAAFFVAMQIDALAWWACGVDSLVLVCVAVLVLFAGLFSGMRVYFLGCGSICVDGCLIYSFLTKLDSVNSSESPQHACNTRRRLGATPLKIAE